MLQQIDDARIEQLAVRRLAPEVFAAAVLPPENSDDPTSLDEQIPLELYEAVAEVIGFVLRANARRL